MASMLNGRTLNVTLFTSVMVWRGGVGRGADPAFLFILSSCTFFVAFPNPVFGFCFFFFGEQISVRCRFALSIDILNYTLV